MPDGVLGFIVPLVVETDWTVPRVTRRSRLVAASAIAMRKYLDPDSDIGVDTEETEPGQAQVPVADVEGLGTPYGDRRVGHRDIDFSLHRAGFAAEGQVAGDGEACSRDVFGDGDDPDDLRKPTRSIRRRVSRSTSGFPEASRSTAIRSSDLSDPPAKCPSDDPSISIQPVRPVARARIGWTEELPMMSTFDVAGSIS